MIFSRITERRLCFIILFIFVSIFNVSCKKDVNNNPEVAAIIAQDSRLESIKAMNYISYLNKGDVKSACELSILTLKSNIIILKDDSLKILSKEDKDKNSVIYRKIRESLKNEHCGG